MAMTMRAVLDELDGLNGQPIDVIGREQLVTAVARAALLGARGNSGVILSQIVRGAAEELASRPGELVDPVLVAAAFARAADAAYESVRDPAEGTMLSAVRAMAHRVAQELAHMDTPRLGPEATAGRAGRAHRGGARARPRRRQRGRGARPRAAAGAQGGRGGGRRRLRADGDRGGGHRRPARLGANRPGASGHARRGPSPGGARVVDLPLLHQLRGHRRRPRRARLRYAARADRRQRARGRGREHPAGARAHRRARGGGRRSSAAWRRCRGWTWRTCTSRWPTAAPASEANSRPPSTHAACGRGQRARASAGSTRSWAHWWSTAGPR